MVYVVEFPVVPMYDHIDGSSYHPLVGTWLTSVVSQLGAQAERIVEDSKCYLQWHLSGLPLHNR